MKTNFDKLSDIPSKLDIFRNHIKDLEQTVQTIAPQNFESLKAQWPQITVQFNQARNAANDIELLADNLQVKLINELREAAKEGQKVLAV